VFLQPRLLHWRICVLVPFFLDAQRLLLWRTGTRFAACCLPSGLLRIRPLDIYYVSFALHKYGWPRGRANRWSAELEDGNATPVDKTSQPSTIVVAERPNCAIVHYAVLHIPIRRHSGEDIAEGIGHVQDVLNTNSRVCLGPRALWPDLDRELDGADGNGLQRLSLGRGGDIRLE